MPNSLLNQLINSLTPQECETGKKWLAQFDQNSNAKLAVIFGLTVDQLQLGIEADVDAIIEKIHCANGLTPARKRKLGHELLQQLEDFLVAQDIQKDEWTYNQHLLRMYRKRGLNQHLQRRINQFKKQRDTAEGSASLSRFQLDYQREKEQYSLLASKKRSDKHNLEEVELSLLHQFLAQRFRQAAETLAHYRIFRRDAKLPLLAESLASYASQPTPHLPGIHLFYLATLLYLETETDPIFQELKQGIEAHIAEFPTQDQRNLIVLAINHCLRQSNAGRLEFLPQTLALYKLGLERKLFYENNQIGIFTFNNILGVALRLEETDWAENFLEQNACRLPAEKREEVESLSRARLSFIRQDYDQALSHLRTADYQDFIHHLTARVMQLKIYYERDSYNLLTSHIRSTKSLLRRRKNLGYHQRNYLNIFTLAEKIIKLPPGDRAATKSLRAVIEETEPCTEKEWLLKVVG